ncbi:13952_t:CDS:1, partial [Cetraspora pellucida]
LISGKYYIGQCYDNGYDVIKNLSHSFNWYLKSAEEGNASGQNEIGYCLMYGERTHIEEEKGLKWYIKSIENGSYLGHCNAGCYYEGIGDYTGAFENYVKSAEGGSCLGQYNLAHCYNDGIGTNHTKLWYHIY